MPDVIFEEGAYDPTDWQHEMTPEWVARWEVLSDRFVAEAKRRGGTGARLGYTVRLHAPRKGECITISPLEPQAALVEVCGRRVTANWELEDQHPNANVELVVGSIMEGRSRMLDDGRMHVWYDGGSLGQPTIEGEPVSAWEA